MSHKFKGGFANMYKKILIFLLISLVFVNLSAAQKRRVDPILAGILSLHTGGLGQFYCEDYLKGTIIWLVDNAIFLTTIFLIADMNFSISKDAGIQFSINLKRREEIKTEVFYTFLGLSLGFIGFRIFSMIDAANTAIEKNKRFCMRRIPSVEPERSDPFIAGLLSWMFPSLGQFYNKDYTKGSIIISLDLLQKGLFCWLMWDLHNRYTGDNDDIVKWDELAAGDKVLVIGYFVLHFGLRFYSIIDAVNVAAGKVQVQLQTEIDGQGIKLGLACKI